MDLIEKNARERARRYYFDNPQIKDVKLIDKEGHVIQCECGNKMFKLYTKIGGIIIGKRNKVIANNPIIFNYVCKCGRRLILKEGNFGYAKIKYGCAAQLCPFNKNKMDKKCLTCEYIYEK